MTNADPVRLSADRQRDHLHRRPGRLDPHRHPRAPRDAQDPGGGDMSQRLRGTVIGCGFFAENHLNAWATIPDVELVAVCDLDPAKAESAARAVRRRARTTPTPPPCCARPKPDFVDIATTVPSHRPLVELAASMKVPAIVQKPFGPTLADCEAMVAACADAGVPLMVHENFRFQPPLRRIARADRPGPDRHAPFRPDHLPHRPRHLRQAALPRDRGAVRHLGRRRARPRHGALLPRRGHLDRLPHQAGEPEDQGRGQRHHAAAAPGRRGFRGRRAATRRRSCPTRSPRR